MRWLLILALDGLATVASLYAAHFLRFEGRVPSAWLETAALAAPILVLVRLACTVTARLHRWSFKTSGLSEAVRLGLTALAGTVLFVLTFSFVSAQGLPRSVVALEFFFTTSLALGFRFAPRLIYGWYAEQRRAQQAGGRRTIIVGAGSAGDLLLRDLVRSSDHVYVVVGFVDDDPGKAGTSLGGKPILGSIADLSEIIERHHVTTVMLAIARLPAARIREILRLCASRKVSFKIIPSTVGSLKRRVAVGMLQDVSPEDLLPRDQVVFDRAEIRSLVAGRRILITGGAGSIGGEIARQVIGHGAASVLLVDINENELYLLSRQLAASHPEVRIQVEVADIRDAGRIQRLGAQHRPHHVFHAAAHKHVPLMENAPEEAVKNNVLGTLNVARMADACGAERLVFISTDKAVRPSSVMGVSKRVGELIVRDLSRRSRTKVTAVRFGNVLGSAGSVVPIFKQQIVRGGPVTVTHPDCSRYFMTVSEAVGLVLLAGLGGYGELCVLDMGEAIRIEELAEHMITLAGCIPGQEIPIVFTGLRPGEKLHEELLTEDEERVQTVRNRIHATASPPPPPDLTRRLDELHHLAEVADRPAILRAFQQLVPTYRVTSNEPGVEGTPELPLARVVPLKPVPAERVRELP